MYAMRLKLEQSVFLIVLTLGIQIAAQDKCPQISVSGPAGQTNPGETMTFTANVDVPNFEKLLYKWIVSAGTIEQGTNGPHILVRTGRENAGQRITAKVEITGLPERCPNTGTENGEVYGGGDPPLLAEFDVFSGKRFRSELDEIARDFVEYPEWFLYVITYGSRGDSDSTLARRENLIKDYLTKTRKIDAKRIVLVRGGERRPLVKIYRVPPAPTK
jgi:hypothetical protein